MSSSSYSGSTGRPGPASDLTGRIMHADIMLPILSFLPPTHLPPVLRASRYLYSLATPLLYADLPLGSFSRTSLCPHLSPVGSLFPPGASQSDLRATLHDRPNRKRLAMESARVLRVGYHTHSVLPDGMEDLRLNMGKVEVLHVEGSAICHHDACPILPNLKPKVIVLESSSLALDRIGGVSPSAAVHHLIVKLRPTNFGRFPSISPDSLPLFFNVQRLTLIFTPHTYLDRKGEEVKETWRPTTRSKCGEYYWTARPSFDDLLRHILEASRGVANVQIVGAEQLGREWVEAEHEQGCCIRQRKDGWLDRELQRVSKVMEVDDEEPEEAMRPDMTTLSLKAWMGTSDGAHLEAPPITSGFKGKGVPRRPALAHKAATA